MLVRRLAAQALLAGLLLPSSAFAQDSFMPGFMAFEAKLKDRPPPAWQMMARISAKSEADVNPLGNRLMSALVNFVKKRGDEALGVIVNIKCDEASFDLWSKVMAGILEEASSRTSARAIEKLDISVTLADPVSKAEKTLAFKKQ